MHKATLNSHWQSLLVFLLIGFAVFAFGGLFQPGDWYLQLNRAPWSPPNIAFPITWAFLYVMIAICGWQLHHSQNKTLTLLWWVQLALNGLWSWLFFGQHWTLLGLVDLILIDVLVISLAFKSWKAGFRLSGLTLLPYIAWLLLASSLNAYIVFAN